MRTAGILASRETKRMDLELEQVRLDGRFSGYASLFDAVDQSRDAIAKGAFAGSLKNRKPSEIRMLYQHDPDQPIGVWTKIEEDQKGLYVEGRITRGVARSEEILELMRAGAIDGLSIGFKTKRARVNPTTKVRWVLAADLWEISVVTFPLLESARIETVKSAGGNALPTTREFERWLVRDAGLSRSDARLVMADGYHALCRKQDAAPDQSLAMKIREATLTLKARKKT